MKKRRMLLGLLLGVAILAGCGSNAVTVPPLQEPVSVTLDKTAAYIGDIYNVTYYDSAVVPTVEALSFTMDGTVGNVCFYPGMEVNKGDVLVELDVTEEKARAQALQAELEHTQIEGTYNDTMAQLDIELLQVELEELQMQGATATEIALKENEIAQKQAQLRQAQQLRALETEAKQQELEKLKETLTGDKLYAPFSGQILYSADLAVGTPVKAYDAIVFLADNSRLQLLGEYIQPGVMKTADRIVAHIGDSQYEIEEETMDEDALNAALISGSAMESRFSFLTPQVLEGKVEAGQYAAILLYSDYISDTLLIPRDAVKEDAAGSYVYVDADGSRERRDVKLGKVTGGLAQILEGLQEGEVVYVQ